MLPCTFFALRAIRVHSGVRCYIPSHLQKKSVLLSDIQRDVQPSPFPFFKLSRNESCQSARKGDVQSSNSCESSLPLELEVERRNSKYDLESRGCCMLL
ncbi:hypothetical protein AVEN_123717-1 [Araneus ventricosus]|uniref:Uncharacterized protein n=1 Tax=Araneus ventricosus TaxID=182803 RepID=A0A4Y2U2G2_ARAVE|nr:hypothetical protein AVEN_123717-1 [Araneus ventricosus]